MEKLVSDLVEAMGCLPEDNEEIRDKFAVILADAEDMGSEIVELRKQVFILNRKIQEFEEKFQEMESTNA